VRTTTVHCDRCKARIDGPMSTLETAGELADTLPRIDLCSSCGRALVEFLRAVAAPAQGRERSPLLLDREPFHP
jgi:hypothetical protein